MEIPDNWLDEICVDCELIGQCDETEEMCNCSGVLYDIMRVFELIIEKEAKE